MNKENKMYDYLLEHNYISKNENKNPLRQQELSEERAKCIANKYNNLIKQLEQENQQLKEEIKGYQQMYFDKVMIINKAIEMLEKYPITSKLDSDYILVNDLLEILKGDSNK